MGVNRIELLLPWMNYLTFAYEERKTNLGSAGLYYLLVIRRNTPETLHLPARIPGDMSRIDWTHCGRCTELLSGTQRPKAYF